MNDDIIVRRAAPADLPVLGRLGALLMRAHHDFDPCRFMAPAEHAQQGYAGFLGEQLEQDTAAIFVAERGGTVLGYVYAAIEGKAWKELRDVAGFIHDVAVVESERRQGLGARLLDVAAQWLAGQGVPRVMLWTAEQNAGAQRLFAKLGFRRTMIEMTREVAR